MFEMEPKVFNNTPSHYDLRWDYIAEIGERARMYLEDGQPVSIDYQPGNGTRYPMVLTPMKAIKQLSQWSIPSGHSTEVENVVVVAMVESGLSYSFTMLNRHAYLAPGYVAGKLGYNGGGEDGGNEADGQALSALFAAIAGDDRVAGLRPPEVADA